MRGVDRHSAVGVKLYEKLVHPSIDFREQISDDLYKLIKDGLRNNEDWKILEPGIGGGWIDLYIIRKIINDDNGPKNVSLYGIDSSQKMLDEFKNNISSEFAIDEAEIKSDEDCAYKISIKKNTKNITINLYHQNCLELKDFEDSINIILIFFLFHHLGNKWQNELIKYIKKINNGFIILSEVRGDQACWSYSFDKIYNFDELQTNKDRLIYLQFIKYFQEQCENIGWFNYRPITAASTNFERDILNNYGFNKLKSVTKEFSKKICIEDWLKSGGFKFSDDENPYRRVFSVFPEFKDKDSEEKKKFEKNIFSFFQSDKIIYDDSSERWEIPEDSIIKKEITIHDCLTYYIFQKNNREISKEQTNQISKNQKDILNYFLSLHPYSSDYEKNFDFLVRDILILLRYDIIKKPIAIIPINWNLENDEWIRNVPFFSKKEIGLTQILKYNILTLSFLQDFRATDLIYKDLPIKCKIIYEFVDDSKLVINESFTRDGNINVLEFKFPKKGIIKESFRQYFNENYTKLINQYKDKINKIKQKTIKNDNDYLILNNDKISDLSKEIGSKFIEKPKNENEVFDVTMLKEYSKILYDKLNLFSEYSGNKLWKIDKETCEKLIKSISFSELSGVGKLIHYPSKDSLDLKTNSEIATGGLIIHYSKDTEVNDEQLITLLNLRNRSSFIEQHKAYTIKRITRKSLQSAIAAIMSRNGSHNIGSHIISAASSNINDYSDTQTLLKYIQQRMDFIATVTTEFPNWTYPAWLTRDLMRRFYEQRLVLNYIAESEGVNAFEFQPNEDISKQENKLLIKIQVLKNGEKQPKEIIGIAKSVDEYKENIKFDILIAIPGGIIGHQAFYTIMENIIRNSAKHGWAKDKENKPKNLEITINIMECKDKDYNIVEIWDNVSSYSCKDGDFGKFKKLYELKNGKLIEESDDDFNKLPLHKQMNHKLMKSFIDQTGKLLKDNWGLAEIKICAGFLNKKSVSEIGAEGFEVLFKDGKSDKEKNGFISAYAQNINDEKYTLGYKFPVLKPKEVLILDFPDSDKYSDQAKKYSIYFSNDNSDFDYEFVVLYDDGKNEFINKIKNYLKEPDKKNKENVLSELKNEIEQYPYRLFIICDNNKYENLKNEKLFGFLRERLVVLSKNEFPFKENKKDKEKETINYDEFKLWLYSKWVDHLIILRSPEDKDLKLLINVTGNSGHGQNGEKIAEIVFKIFKNSIVDLLNELEYYNDSENLKNVFWGNVLNNSHSNKIEEANELSSALLKSFECSDDAKKYVEVSVETFWKTTKQLFMKYEEEIETLPEVFKANGESNVKWKVDKYLKNVTITKDENSENINISYNRHYIKEDAKIYSEATSGSQIYFSILSHFDKDDEYLKSKIIFQLLENSMLRTLIIDERVSQFLQKDENMKVNFNYAQIIVPDVVSISNDDKEIPLIQNLSNEKYHNINKIILDEISSSNYEVLIIHQGVLEKLLGSDKNMIGEFLNQVKEKIPFIIVTSGRGAPSTLPDNAKLLAFSNLESFLLKSYHEKFLLMQIIMKINANSE